MMKFFISISIFLLFSVRTFAQKDSDSTIFPFKKYEIKSKYLNENREHWVSLPLGYSDTNLYPVIYVFDAEWRFDIIRNISFYYGAEQRINSSIIVGIPYIDMVDKRGKNLTFSHSKIEYDGDKVDEDWYTSKNSGGGENFYNYLTKEVMSSVNKDYKTNGHETIIGHSYGGYFGLYILTRNHPFEVIHCYDPSVWFSDGEVTKMLQKKSEINMVKLFISYQPEPKFHNDKIEEFIELAKKNSNIDLHHKKYPNENHNSLFMDSFITGIKLTNKP